MRSCSWSIAAIPRMSALRQYRVRRQDRSRGSRFARNGSHATRCDRRCPLARTRDTDTMQPHARPGHGRVDVTGSSYKGGSMDGHALRGAALAALLAAMSPTLAHDDRDDDLRFVPSSLSCKRYDGASDDLLTAGLGKSGLGNPAAPAVAVPASPTATELR